MRSLFCKSVRPFLVKMSLGESAAHATFSLMVRPYLVNGMAVFVNCRYGRFRRLDDVLFINGTCTTVRGLKVKQYYG